jgi:Fe-S cluster assembly iron-binding protein IscA
MLTLTPTAAEAVRTLVAGTEVADDTGGLRIAPGESSDGPALSLALVDAPQTTDQSIESEGAQVYLEPTVAQMLDDKTLDARVEEGQVRFGLFDRRQAEEPPASG